MQEQCLAQVWRKIAQEFFLGAQVSLYMTSLTQGFLINTKASSSRILALALSPPLLDSDTAYFRARVARDWRKMSRKIRHFWWGGAQGSQDSVLLCKQQR